MNRLQGRGRAHPTFCQVLLPLPKVSLRREAGSSQFWKVLPPCPQIEFQGSCPLTPSSRSNASRRARGQSSALLKRRCRSVRSTRLSKLPMGTFHSTIVQVKTTLFEVLQRTHHAGSMTEDVFQLKVFLTCVFCH